MLYDHELLCLNVTSSVAPTDSCFNVVDSNFGKNAILETIIFVSKIMLSFLTRARRIVFTMFFSRQKLSSPIAFFPKLESTTLKQLAVDATEEVTFKYKSSWHN